ncbi:MAG: hypothetical protein R6V49_02325 [Bacteroidales bacterium]
MNISMTGQDLTSLNGDTLKSRIMNEWIEGVSKDIYIDETTRIVLDILEPKSAGKGKRK